MLYRIMADGVVFVHFFWILFLIAGAYWGRKDQAVMVIQGAGLLFSIIMQIFGWYCPLTHLEVWLRSKQDPVHTYPGSFIAHYAEKLIYLEISPLIISALTVILVGVNVFVYWKACKSRKDTEDELAV